MVSSTIFSTQAVSKIPEFIQDGHPLFTDFLTAYYEYLESDGQAIFGTDHIEIRRDSDLTGSDFLQYFQSEYLWGFPAEILADKALMIQHIQDFYLSKGTEASLKLLFRLLYNEDISVYLPSQDILRASDGKWQLSKSIRVTVPPVVTDSSNLVVSGLTSGATAVIEFSQQSTLSATTYLELFLADIDGVFLQGESVQFGDSTETVIGVLSAISVPVPGSGYSVGDALEITGTGTNAIASVTSLTTGSIESLSIDVAGVDYVVGDQLVFSTVSGATQALGRVTTVDGAGGITGIKLISGGKNYSALPFVSVSSDLGLGAEITSVSSTIGGIKAVSITEFGIDYTTDPSVTATSSGNGDAILTGSVGALCAYPGYWLDNDGKLSSEKKLQDNFFYQDFSYVIQSGRPVTSYKDFLTDILHPAGLLFFGETFIIMNLAFNSYILDEQNLNSIEEYDLSISLEARPREYEFYNNILSYMQLGPTVQEYDRFKFTGDNYLISTLSNVAIFSLYQDIYSRIDILPSETIESTIRKSQPGQAIQYNKEMDYLTMPSISFTGAFSIGGWFNKQEVLIYYVAGSTTNDFISISSTQISIRIAGVTQNYSLDSSILDSFDYHLGVTRDSSDNVLIYINGLLQSDTKVHSGTITIDRQARYASANYKFSSFGLFLEDTTLNSINLNKVMDFDTSFNFGGLSRFYKQDERFGPTVYDSSGSGQHGTITESSVSNRVTQSTISYNDLAGYTYSYPYYIPRNESSLLHDVLGDPLDYTGSI